LLIILKSLALTFLFSVLLRTSKYFAWFLLFFLHCLIFNVLSLHFLFRVNALLLYNVIFALSTFFSLFFYVFFFQFFNCFPFAITTPI